MGDDDWVPGMNWKRKNREMEQREGGRGRER